MRKTRNDPVEHPASPPALNGSRLCCAGGQSASAHQGLPQPLTSLVLNHGGMLLYESPRSPAFGSSEDGASSVVGGAMAMGGGGITVLSSEGWWLAGDCRSELVCCTLRPALASLMR